MNLDKRNGTKHKLTNNQEQKYLARGIEHRSQDLHRCGKARNQTKIGSFAALNAYNHQPLEIVARSATKVLQKPKQIKR